MWTSRPLARDQDALLPCKLSARLLPLGTHQLWGNPAWRAISHLISYRNLSSGFHRAWSHSWELWRNKKSFRKTPPCESYAAVSVQFESKSSAPGASMTPASRPGPDLSIYLVYFWRQNIFYMFCMTLGEAASSEVPPSRQDYETTVPIFHEDSAQQQEKCYQEIIQKLSETATGVDLNRQRHWDCKTCLMEHFTLL